MKKLHIILLLLLTANISANAMNRSPAVEKASYNKSISKAIDSVVSVYASKSVANLEQNMDIAYGRQFIDDFISSIDPEIKISKENAVGSGVIVSKNGIIITNSHIVADSQEIRIITSDEKVHTADILALDKSLDLAIIKIRDSKNANFKAITFEDSDSALIGDVVFALGNPFGIGKSVSMGIISAIGRNNLDLEYAQYLIQTDAAINPGNSGGALINMDGNLIGINSAILSKTDGFSGVGFSVPSNAVRFIIDSMNSSGSIQSAWLGAKGDDMTDEIAKQHNIAEPKGVYINRIYPNSPALKAGVKAGDVLVKLHNKSILNNKQLNGVLTNLPVDKKVNLRLIRNNRVVDVEVMLKPLTKRADTDRFIIRGINPFSGIVVEKLSPELNYMLNNKLDKKGVAVVDRPAKITNLNVQVGDVIVGINQVKINNLKTLQAILAKKAPYGYKIVLLRNNKQINIFVK